MSYAERILSDPGLGSLVLILLTVVVSLVVQIFDFPSSVNSVATIVIFVTYLYLYIRQERIVKEFHMLVTVSSTDEEEDVSKYFAQIDLSLRARKVSAKRVYPKLYLTDRDLSVSFKKISSKSDWEDLIHRYSEKLRTLKNAEQGRVKVANIFMRGSSAFAFTMGAVSNKFGPVRFWQYSSSSDVPYYPVFDSKRKPEESKGNVEIRAPEMLSGKAICISLSTGATQLHPRVEEIVRRENWDHIEITLKQTMLAEEDWGKYITEVYKEIIRRASNVTAPMHLYMDVPLGFAFGLGYKFGVVHDITVYNFNPERQDYDMHMRLPELQKYVV